MSSIRQHQHRDCRTGTSISIENGTTTMKETGDPTISIATSAIHASGNERMTNSSMMHDTRTSNQVMADQAMADQFSSSLAKIAAESTKKNNDKNKSKDACHTNNTETGSNNGTSGDDEGSGSGGQETSSSSHTSNCSSGRPAMVTAGNTTTSSGAASSQKDSTTGSSAGSGTDENINVAVAMAGGGGGGSSSSSSSSNVAAHHHHHHNKAQHQQPHQHERDGRQDSYGLPTSDIRDDRVSASSTSQAHHQQQQQQQQQQNQQQKQYAAAVVMAHSVPPKQESFSSSGSGAESADFAGNDGQQQQLSSQQLSKHDASNNSLLQPHREPGFHTIRRTFNRLVMRSKGHSSRHQQSHRSETDSFGDAKQQQHKYKRPKQQDQQLSSSGMVASTNTSPTADKKIKDTVSKTKKRKHPSAVAATQDRGSDADDSGGDSGGNGSSSGSGTEGGYAGSASSNENAQHTGSCSSPSESSSEESVTKDRSSRHHHHAKMSNGAGSSATMMKAKSGTPRDPSRPMIGKKQDSTLSVSSEIADFSSASSEGDARPTFASAFRQSPSRSPSISSSDEVADEESFEGIDGPAVASTAARIAKKAAPSWPAFAGMHLPATNNASRGKMVTILDKKMPAVSKTITSSSTALLDGKPPIMAVGCDVMAHVLTFLEPPDILQVLTMPLSKDWLNSFTRQGELWRVLCLLEPFKAPVENDTSGSNSDSSDESFDSFSSAMNTDIGLRNTFGKFRLLYTSFVRCLHYLSRIQQDAINGRAPSVIDYGGSQAARENISANRNLHQFLARARGYVVQQQNNHNQVVGDEDTNSDISEDDSTGDAGGAARPPQVAAAGLRRDSPVGVSDDGSSTSAPFGRHSKKRRSKKDRSVGAESHDEDKKKKPRVKYAHSKLTARLLGPTAEGTPGSVELPWSCAIYSIVNWMVAFANVEGIQTMCLKVLPFLLEDEQQRITAQRAGLTNVVLRGMVMFPNSPTLHTAAFHTIVLLARPLGGHEGMLFHSSMLNSSGIFSSVKEDGTPTDGRNGIAVMLDSMRRFQHNEILQAMSCWALVNIALAPPQKEMLVKLGGIQVTANAMTLHPFSAEVQFRALFALINLVIPSVSVNANGNGGDQPNEAVPVEDSSEKEMLDEMVDHVVNLVVLAMKNFCASEAILNRACLVLHNLSLAQEYHSALLWTPNCYQMLEWCLGNYPTDQVLQQSAAGTLHRLQMTLSSDESLRTRFAASIQSQQQLSLEQAHREAILLHEQQEQQRLNQQQ